MYVKVKLLNGFQKPLTYAIPSSWPQTPVKGTIISVPLKKTVQFAVVDEVMDNVDQESFAIRPALKLEAFPPDEHYGTFIERSAHYYMIDPRSFLRRIQFFLKKEKDDDVIHSPVYEANQHATMLTEEQEAAYNAIAPAVLNKEFFPILLDGVTGSGKSEVYKKLIELCIAERKTAILLLPEVTLALQFYTKFKSYFAESLQLFSFHSGTSAAEKRVLWQALMQQQPVLIIGVHLPIMLPISNLGLIIVDEEHEVGYQEKKHPKLNSKELALMRAQATHIPIVLGSATPSMTTLYNVRHKGWHAARLTKRYGGAFPTVRTVALLTKQKRRSFWISNELEEAIREKLLKKEQIILFINRRGFSFFVQCADCGFIAQCTQCSVSLTLHEDNKLYCHYCDYVCILPQACPSCAHQHFIKKGIGTQQLAGLIKQLFPQAVVERADLDTSQHKRTFKKTLQAFEDGAIDILVGTQTITKGFHFPRVTLVGIIWADINVNFPMYNATETALQQLIQVAGRAGRQQASSEVIVQMMTENRIQEYTTEISYQGFVDDELAFRETFRYPPFCRLAEIEVKHEDEIVLIEECKKILHTLQLLKERYQLDVLGPANPAVYKLKNAYRKRFYIKASNSQLLSMCYQEVKKIGLDSALYFTPNPLN